MKEFRVSFDDELIERFRNGDTRVFAMVHDMDYQTYVYFTYQITQDKDAAVSIVTESYVKLWKLHENFNSAADIKAFMYTVCRNEAYTFNRDRSRKSEVLVADMETELDNRVEGYNARSAADQENEVFLLKAELHSMLNEKIKQLPKQPRKVINLVKKGLSNDEIAKRLRVSVNAVKVAKTKAINQLRNDLIVLLISILLLNQPY